MRTFLLLLFVLLTYTTILPQNEKEPTFTLDTVIISSGRYEKNINDLPYSASVVGGGKITKSTSETVPDLLKTETGITLLSDGIWATDISIRGMNRSNIVTLIDGNRIETSNDVSARLSMIDINDIDRIEVIKGAASTLYGTGATGGIVNIISQKVNYSDNLFIKGSLHGGFNSVNNNYLSGVSLFSGSHNWAAKLTGSFRKADNTHTPAGILNNSQFQDNSISGEFSFKPLQNHEVILDYQQFNAENVGIPGAYPLFPNNAKVSYPDERRKMFSAGYNITNITRVFRKLTARYYYQFMRRDVDNVPYQIQNVPAANGQSAKRVSVLDIQPSAKHKTNGFQLQTDFLFNERHYVISGIDYWKRTYNGERTKSQKIDVLGSDGKTVVKTMYKSIMEKPLPDAGYASAGVFVQDEIRVIDNRLNLTLGARADFINIDNDETKNPLYEINDGVINNRPSNQTIIWKAGKAKNSSYTYNAGLLYSLSEHLNISFNAARSFRSPSLEERYQYIDQGNIIRLGDPQLKPEKGYFFDLGLRTSGKFLRVTTSVFYNYLNDLVTEIPGVYENRNAFIKTNIGKANLYGFEIETNYNIFNSLMQYNSVSYVRGRNLKDETDLPQIPPLNGTAGIKYAFSGALEADLSAQFFTAQKNIAPGEISTPGYIIFNMNLSSFSVNFNKLVFKFNAGVENIFNKEYRNHLSTNRGFITCEPGRNIYLKTNISW